MAYRNGNYIAFDGLGELDPTKSDFKYYSTIQAWASGKGLDFKYVNSHDKTYAVRNSSLRPTLETRIRERLAASKNVVVILSDRTRRSGSMLSYEIEKAVDRYELPLICAYTNYFKVTAPEELSHRWPEALEQRINNGTAKAIHIPFKKNALLDAIGQFTVHGHTLTNGLNFYTLDAHREFGCLE
ncbi:TIR domain-containing protein [Roseovarius sp. A46]|uniref:TIR domain-containing protein n=1 Tax=Roseovarius sp. A46 TaxID=2109331 RepID=UPI001011EF3E|nr:TIR domain-containing protein [Roseovarius sp. A46]